MGFLGKDKLLLLDLRAESAAVVKGTELEALTWGHEAPPRPLDEEGSIEEGRPLCAAQILDY